MNYIGSKLSLLDFIEESINKVVSTNATTFCDLFAGTGVVGRHFKRKGYRIIANDIQYYSYVLNRHYIGNSSPLRFNKLRDIIPKIDSVEVDERKRSVCNYLSNIKGVKGFIYENYCLGGTQNKEHQRMYFSDENGMICDAIRQTIEYWKKNNLISDDEYYFLLASLIESIDKRANTASVYGAFLKKLKKTALVRLELMPAELTISNASHDVLNKDANEAIKKIHSDILYLDPPYNQRQYATNYHILETVALYDNPKIYGKTGLRDYKDQKSSYSSKVKVKESFKELISNANSKYIFLSYNDEGLMSLEDIKEIMSSRGKYGFFKKEYQRFKADRAENRNFSSDKTIEYLHFVICD